MIVNFECVCVWNYNLCMCRYDPPFLTLQKAPEPCCSELKSSNLLYAVIESFTMAYKPVHFTYYVVLFDMCVHSSEIL